MAKDGTNRGGRRVRAGDKPDALADKIANGREATVMGVPMTELNGAELTMPPTSTARKCPSPANTCRQSKGTAGHSVRTRFSVRLGSGSRSATAKSW